MKVLFVGLGSIGQRHLRNLRRLMGSQVTISAYRARGAAGLLDDQGRFNPALNPADYHGVRLFPTLAEALLDRPTVTFVTNPTALHVETARAAVEAGSHVLIEKPLSSSPDGLDELLDAVAQRGVVAAVAYQMRFHPALMTVKAWLDDGRIGRIVSARLVNGEYMPGWHAYEDYRNTYASRRDLGGGAIGTQSHELDCALWLFGAPTSVFAAGGHLSDLDIDVEDVATMTLDGVSGGKRFPVSVQLDYLQKPPSKHLVVVGTTGTIRCDLIACTADLTDVATGETTAAAWPDFQRNDMYLALLERFFAAVEGGPPAMVPIHEAVTTMRTISAAHASLSSHQPVAV